jgi:predicted nucleotidyltransferase
VDDQLHVIKDVARRLEDSGIPYMLTGSFVLGAYTIPRMTRDVDVVVELAPEAGRRLPGLLGEEFYCDEVAVQRAIAQKRLFNVVHQQTLVKIDMIVRKDSPHGQAEFARRRRLPIDGIEFWIVTAEDLILSKLSWAKASPSEQQFRDVRSTLRANPDLDWAYVETWAVRLGIGELLSEMRT